MRMTTGPEDGDGGDRTGGGWRWGRRLEVVGVGAEEGDVVMFFLRSIWLFVKGKKKRKHVFGIRTGGVEGKAS